jgi:hypothetical protein
MIIVQDIDIEVSIISLAVAGYTHNEGPEGSHWVGPHGLQHRHVVLGVLSLDGAGLEVGHLGLLGVDGVIALFMLLRMDGFVLDVGHGGGRSRCFAGVCCGLRCCGSRWRLYGRCMKGRRSVAADNRGCCECVGVWCSKVGGGCCKLKRRGFKEVSRPSQEEQSRGVYEGNAVREHSSRLLRTRQMTHSPT